MSFDSDDSAALRMLTQFHGSANLKEWLRAAFAFRLAYKERLEMFYDEKTGKIAQIVIDEILKLSLPDLERLNTDLFFKKLLCRCREIELLNAAGKGLTDWYTLTADFEELYEVRDDIQEQGVYAKE